jgi:hypothetical protein
MEFVCPICETSANITKDDVDHSINKATCNNCGAILLINPASGKVEAHKSPFKDSPILETSENASTDDAVPSKRSQGKGSKDWVAIVCFALILIFLISAGIYFALHSDIF